MTSSTEPNPGILSPMLQHTPTSLISLTQGFNHDDDFASDSDHGQRSTIWDLDTHQLRAQLLNCIIELDSDLVYRERGLPYQLFSPREVCRKTQCRLIGQERVLQVVLAQLHSMSNPIQQHKDV